MYPPTLWYSGFYMERAWWLIIREQSAYYREEGLTLRRRRTKKLVSQERVELSKAERVNEQWSMDFVCDALSNGRRIRLLMVIDMYTRECLRIEVDTSIGGDRVATVLSRIGAIMWGCRSYHG